jgi:polyhydroxybutyrate depolymerase
MSSPQHEARGIAPLLALALAVVFSLSACSSGGSDGTAYGPSEGCDGAEPGSSKNGADLILTVDGEDRIYNLTLPRGAGAGGRGEPMPLVVAMHGATGTNEGLDRSSELADLAKKEGFVLVSPQALGASPIWDLDPDGPDARFIDELIDHMEASACIDTGRIYLTGFSMGGMMSLLMACQEPERFAAIAPVAGMVEIEPCDRDESVPLIAFHGTKDASVGFDGVLASGVAPLVGYDAGPPVRDLVGTWAADNGCAGQPTEARAGSDVAQFAYDCPPTGSVELFVVENGTHTWPGSELTKQYFPREYTTLEIEASELIWAFFEAHPRSPTP